MSIAISGSIAFDTIMVFEGRFADHILPDQVQMLKLERAICIFLHFCLHEG